MGLSLHDNWVDQIYTAVIFNDGCSLVDRDQGHDAYIFAQSESWLSAGEC